MPGVVGTMAGGVGDVVGFCGTGEILGKEDLSWTVTQYFKILLL